MYREWGEWKAHLSGHSQEAFCDVCWSDRQLISANEILDKIVRYEGGVATGAEIRELVAEVYGVRLSSLRLPSER